MTQPSQLPLRAVVLLVAVSAPLALALETVLRNFVIVPMIGPELEEIREFYWPALTDELREAALTHAAWILVGVCALAGVLGVVLLRGAARRGIERARAEPNADPAELARIEVRDRILLLTSIPQVPAILATLCFAFGSRLLPVLVCMVVSTGFVVAQGLVGERLLATIGR